MHAGMQSGSVGKETLSPSGESEDANSTIVRNRKISTRATRRSREIIAIKSAGVDNNFAYHSARLRPRLQGYVHRYKSGPELSIPRHVYIWNTAGYRQIVINDSRYDEREPLNRRYYIQIHMRDEN